MPEGPAERGVEANAKSIDGAEHSGMLKGVMAANTSGIRIGCRSVLSTWPEDGTNADQI